MQSDEKLQKVLARAGLGSRREMETWISEGRVSIDGRVANLGDRVTGYESILVDGQPLQAGPLKHYEARILLYNKPEGEVVTRKDPDGRPTVFDRLPRLQGQRWIAVGRLDINTSGLLLFTTDGELANKLMHPSTQIDREYAVRIMGEVKDEVLETLKKGVMLDDGPARFTDVRFFDGQGINRWYHCVVMEGRNREVRRLWESQQVQVSRLKRVRFGHVFLPSRLKTGQWEEIQQKDAKVIYEMAGLEPKKVPQKTAKEQASWERQQRKSGVKPSAPRKRMRIDNG
ncbi:23S rRNA pseudouridine(2605) synthase RluB [Balneatrix alpica]|uniref:Pseudouridine synthase n=1 Tax=Balneatrix alpica TaxID=75684 RepID=A0ABV5Z8A6_9GAMM|nr:23S rRNA pseudouridine(2605) synthase RluB [Balneatrix alpica]